jgi:hypothetical protein
VIKQAPMYANPCQSPGCYQPAPQYVMPCQTPDCYKGQYQAAPTYQTPTYQAPMMKQMGAPVYANQYSGASSQVISIGGSL